MKYVQTTARARRLRQRVPAFGEWNYAYVDCAAGDWPVTQYFESGMHHAGGVVVAIPPSPPNKPANKVVKWRESSTTPTLELEDEDEKQRQQHVVALAVGLGDHGSGAVKKQGKPQGPAVAHAYKACPRAAAVKVKAMDQDLYHIPPDMLCHEPRKRLTRSSLWMGCLGLNCVA